MKYFLLTLAGAASLTACSGNKADTVLDKDVLMHNDFENMLGWVPDAALFTDEQAHSGRYSLQVNQDHEYSLAYNYLLGLLSPSRIRGVRVEAWVYMPERNSSAQIRVAVDGANKGETLMKEGIDLGAEVKDTGKWQKVSKEFTFPTNANYTSQLVIYLWRGGDKAKVFMDDVQVIALR